jgi:ATP-dependent RNA helicase DDX18/HAS1
MNFKRQTFIKSYHNSIFHNNGIRQSWLFQLSKNNMLTKHTFEILVLSKPTILKLLEQFYTHMTKIQSVGIPLQICGFDLLGSARTGSGKTIAFSIPIIEFVYTVKWLNQNGSAAIVLSPTRELTLQSYYVIRDLLTFHSYSYGILMGGANKGTEEKKIIQGIAIIIATPGRLLDHLTSNKQFLFSNLQLLVIDEADRCLEIGFEEEMYEILKILPKNRQTILLSATQTKNVENLSRISFKKKPIYIGVDDMLETNSIPEIDQSFLVCKPEDRFILLISLLKKNIGCKIIVFFSSCNEVKFFSDLSRLVGINVLDLHGKQKQFKRTSTFFEFCKGKNSILFCTDVASRGLDIPSVDWIFQVDAPLEPKEYFHRVGRTCRGINCTGKSLLFLLPSEINFLKYLKRKKITINEYKFRVQNWSVVQHKIARIVGQNYYLNKLSKVAFKSFLNSYSSSNLKEIFDLKKLDLKLLSKNFGFSTYSNLNFKLD